jgi:hypothetical protein
VQRKIAEKAMEPTDSKLLSPIPWACHAAAECPGLSGGRKRTQDYRSWTMKKACILILAIPFFSIIVCISAYSQELPPNPCCGWGPRKVMKAPTPQVKFVGSVRSVLDQGMTQRQMLDQLDGSNPAEIAPLNNGNFTAEKNIYNQTPGSSNSTNDAPGMEGVFRDGIENPN